MQAAVSEGCSQANSWLIEIFLKVGWDWTKQSKSLFKPTQICLYLYEIVNWVLKDFRLLPYWLTFHIFLLSVLKNSLLPILIKCSLYGSTTQTYSAAWMERPWELSACCLEPAAQSDLGMAAWPWAEQCPLTHQVPTEAGAGGRRGRRRNVLLLPKYIMSTNTAVTLHLCSPWNFKQQGKGNKLRMRQKGVLPCAGWGAGTGQGTAGMSSLGVRGLWQQLLLRQEGQEAASTPICQSCVQSQAVTALVLIHHIPALPLTPSSSHKLYRQKINFRDTFVLWWPLA